MTLNFKNIGGNYLINLQQARIKSGLRTSFVADYMNCSITHLYRYEKGESPLTSEKAAKLINLYRGKAVFDDIRVGNMVYESIVIYRNTKR